MSVCTLVYCTQLLSPPSSSPTSDDVYPVRAALHAGRRLSAHVLSGRQRQVQSLAAAHGGGVRGGNKSTHALRLFLCTSGMLFAQPFTCGQSSFGAVEDARHLSATVHCHCHSALSSLAWHYLLQHHSHISNTNYHSVQGTLVCT